MPIVDGRCTLCKQQAHYGRRSPGGRARLLNENNTFHNTTCAASPKVRVKAQKEAVRVLKDAKRTTLSIEQMKGNKANHAAKLKVRREERELRMHSALKNTRDEEEANVEQ